MVELDVPYVEKVVLSRRERGVCFDKVMPVRVSAEIEATIKYWVARYPKSSERGFSSVSHFVRAAVIAFDRVQRRLDDDKLGRVS